MFTISNKGKIVSVLSSNVDDLLFGSLQGYEEAMDKTLNTFSVRERNSREFRFCGKEVVQDENFNITVTAKDNTEKIRPIDIGEKRRGCDKNTPEETTCLRSVVARGLLAKCAQICHTVCPGSKASRATDLSRT